MPSSIPAAIKALRDEPPYDALTPKAINRGSCHVFAMDVLEHCPAATLVKTGNETVTGSVTLADVDDPAHIWVTDGQQHYDAEAPNGVDNWRNLPIFQRTL